MPPKQLRKLPKEFETTMRTRLSRSRVKNVSPKQHGVFSDFLDGDEEAVAPSL